VNIGEKLLTVEGVDHVGDEDVGEDKLSLG